MIWKLFGGKSIYDDTNNDIQCVTFHEIRYQIFVFFFISKEIRCYQFLDFKSIFKSFPG